MPELLGITTYPLGSSPPTTVGVPRRFGIGEMMMLVTVYAILFAMISSITRSPQAMFVTGTLLAGVTVGQILLFGGRKPRQASVLVGTLLFPVVVFLAVLFSDDPTDLSEERLLELVGSLVCCLPVGPLFGWMAGTLAAGVFLFQNRIAGNHTSRTSNITLVPFDESHFDALIAWMQSEQLFDLWHVDSFTYPLDNAQLQQHLESMQGENPTRQAFMAVDANEDDCFVGYVELQVVDPQLRTALITRAVIAPEASDRGKLSRAMLTAVLQEAFGRQKFQRVEVLFHGFDYHAYRCYHSLDFSRDGVLRKMLQFAGTLHDAWLMSLLREEWSWKQPRKSKAEIS